MHTSNITSDGKLMYIVGGQCLFPGESLENIGISNLIYSVELETGVVSEVAQMSSMIMSHACSLVNDTYLIIVGGTNGMTFLNTVIRFNLKNKE